MKVALKQSTEARDKLISGDQDEIERVIGDIPQITQEEIWMRPGEYISYGLDYSSPDLNFEAPVKDFLNDLLM